MVSGRLRLDVALFHHYSPGMPPRRRTSKDTPAKLAGRMKRRWRIVLMRKTGQVLGTVEAADAHAAETVAAVQFDLNDFQRRRLLVQGAR